MIITKENFAVIERDTHLSKWVIEQKRLDFDQSALRTYLPLFPKGGTLLNIGANMGCYAYAFRNIAKEIHCFEPNKEAFECLTYNLSKFDNIQLYNSAISDKYSKCTIDNTNDNVGMAYLKEDDSGSITTFKIDQYDFQSCDMILMDCEGFELKALIGAKETIKKFNPIMIIEINDFTLERQGINRQDIFAWLTENGYIYSNIYENAGLNDSQLDIICKAK